MVLSDNVKGAALMAASMAAFVLNDTLTKLASSDIPLFQMLFLRGVLATGLLAGLAIWQKKLKVHIPPQDRKTLAMRLVGEVGATCCFLTALFHMPLANVTAILQALPLAVTLGAAVFLKEPVGWRRWTAIGIGFLGVLIIVRPGSDGFNEFSLLAIASVAFVVLRDLSTRRLTAGVPSVFVALLTSSVITVLGAVMIPLEGWQDVTSHTLAIIWAAALFLVFGYTFSVMTMRIGEIAFVAAFRYTALIWAILLGFLVFGDIPGQWTLVGTVIVVGTGIYSFHRERIRRRLAAKQPQRTI